MPLIFLARLPLAGLESFSFAWVSSQETSQNSRCIEGVRAGSSNNTQLSGGIDSLTIRKNQLDLLGKTEKMQRSMLKYINKIQIYFIDLIRSFISRDNSSLLEKFNIILIFIVFQSFLVGVEEVGFSNSYCVLLPSYSQKIELLLIE